MKQEVKAITIVCDGCGERFHGVDDMCCYLDDPDGELIEQSALDSCWIKLRDKHYCQDCFTIDEDDNIRTKDGKVWPAETITED